jgi:hypothetical protein
MKLHVAVKRGTPVRGRERDSRGYVAFFRAPSVLGMGGRT